MDWNQELERLNLLIQGSPENNRRALPEFLATVEKARTDNSLDAGKAIWWIGSMVDQRMGSKEAELLYRMALQKLEQVLGTNDPQLAGILHSIAYYYCEKERYPESELHYKRLIELREHADSKQLKEMLVAIRDFADSLRKQGRESEAKSLIEQYDDEG